MLNKNQLEQFHKDGFLLIPSVLTQEQVIEIRNSLINLFNSAIEFEGDTNNLRFDICNRYSEFRWLLIHPPIVSVLKSILGENFVYLPEMAAHTSFYSTWHKDTTSQEAAGHQFQWQSDYLMLEVAIYLQDNDEYGGGLDVIPGSHLYPDLTTNREAHEFWSKITPPPYIYSIPSKVGDLILFDFRIHHKASLPTNCSVESIPDSKRKFALFFACSVNNDHVFIYKKFIYSRPSYYYLQDHKYQQDFLKLITDNGLILA
ncbi:phytanoyl-CoA dioxygenase family protein [Anabaena cylindrica UHCC 0172]|uniref:phytanoyl-CoA dioxygenase family protein n=1 Tax=Anabaena cylindrica TaxID=1165 RepID=UPI002B1FE488|nr:phytanoyl-CoA dioxygenase family protein [Anabaena cylindrica]MEA5549891.1 phytanoyl-CoA dioxygenase family protein [Anabaena cylindrica UHCC 0172]